MKRINHISIGIPVFNEEANITQLIHSLFRQKQDTFVLDKIFVLCDGSTDKTPYILKKLTKQYSKLIYIHDPVRRGVTNRTQQLIKLNTSDILIFFDGDTMTKDSETLTNLVSAFDDTSVMLATAALIPIRATTRFEHMLFAWRSIWTTLTHTWNKGNNIYNFRGVGIAIHKNFAKSIRLPKDITGASSHYLYLKAKQHALKSAFCKTAIIHYRLAATLDDYLLQYNRGQNDGKILKSMFPEIYKDEYSIPLHIRIYSLLKNMVYMPLGTITGLVFHMGLIFVKRSVKPSDRNGIWNSVKSTKVLIQNQKVSNI